MELKKKTTYLSFVERILQTQMFAIKKFKENILMFLCKHFPAALEILTQQQHTETSQKYKVFFKVKKELQPPKKVKVLTELFQDYE